MRASLPFVVALGLGAIACRKPLDVRVVRDAPKLVSTAKTSSNEPECAIAGSMSLGYPANLAATRDDDLPFADFADRMVHLETIDVPAFATPRIGVRARAKFGFSLDGWVQHDHLAFSAAQTIELAGKTAYVPRGAKLRMVVGAGKSIVVSPVTRELPRIDVLAGCDAIAIGAVAREETNGFEVAASSSVAGAESIYALVRSTLPIAASPGGEPVFTLQASSGFRVPIVETKEGLHVHLEDGIVVDGWVRPADVEIPKSLHLTGIGCGMGISTSHGLFSVTSLGVASRETPVFVGETTTGAARGAIAIGGSVLVLRVDGGFAEILPRCGEITPAAKDHFFVEASALDIGPRTPTSTLRAACR